MENKLELKHLAPYLPHRLKIAMYATFRGEKNAHLDDYIMGVKHGYPLFAHVDMQMIIEGLGFEPDNNIENDSIVFKPILRPLSDLIKEIEHKGEKFIPFIKLANIYKNDPNFDDLDPKKTVNQSIILMRQYGYDHCQTWVFEKLCEWHFDVFGLIDKGLAVPLT